MRDIVLEKKNKNCENKIQFIKCHRNLKKKDCC